MHCTRSSEQVLNVTDDVGEEFGPDRVENKPV